jgi:hypothetical protein
MEGKSFEQLSPEVRARIEAARAHRRTIEGRDELERIRTQVRQEYPSLGTDSDVFT